MLFVELRSGEHEVTVEGRGSPTHLIVEPMERHADQHTKCDQDRAIELPATLASAATELLEHNAARPAPEFKARP